MSKENVMAPEQYESMVEVMKELAFRGAKEEAIIMRAANAGGITEVITHIKRMRLYAAKQGMVRKSNVEAEDEAEAAPKKRQARKKKTATAAAGSEAA